MTQLELPGLQHARVRVRVDPEQQLCLGDATWPWPVMLLLLRDYATFDYAK